MRALRVRLAVALSVVVALALATLSAVAAFEHVRKSKELTVVRTVDELLATRPVVTSPGTKIWVGVSAKECPVNGQVVVYAIQDGRSMLRPTQLGALVVRYDGVPCDSEKRRLDELVECAGEGRRLELPERSFFMTSVSIGTAGWHELTLRDAQDAIVARAEICATGLELPTLLRLTGESEQAVEPDPDQLGFIECARCSHQWIHAYLSGSTCRPIPHLFLPRPFDVETLRLEVQGDLLVLTSREPDLPLERLAGRLGARWWVNDTPLIEPTDNVLQVGIRGRSSAAIVSSKHRLHLHLDARALGAHPGDRIGLQLLLCDEPRLTNRVDFTVP